MLRTSNRDLSYLWAYEIRETLSKTHRSVLRLPLLLWQSQIPSCIIDNGNKAFVVLSCLVPSTSVDCSTRDNVFVNLASTSALLEKIQNDFGHPDCLHPVRDSRFGCAVHYYLWLVISFWVWCPLFTPSSLWDAIEQSCVVQQESPLTIVYCWPSMFRHDALCSRWDAIEQCCSIRLALRPEPINIWSYLSTSIYSSQPYQNRQTIQQESTITVTSTIIPIDQSLLSDSAIMYSSMIALVGFLASTLALPTNDTTGTSHTLEKRWHYGFAAAYNGDCNGQTLDTRPELKKSSGCTTWSPHGDHVGINYGTGKYGFATVYLYTDANCERPSTTMLQSDDPEDPNPYPSSEVSKSRFPSGFTCVPLSSYTSGIQSVRRSWKSFWSGIWLLLNSVHV